MKSARIWSAAFVLFLSGAALAEQPAAPAKGTQDSAQPPALSIYGPYEDAERHLVRTYNRIGREFPSNAFFPGGRSVIVVESRGISVLDLATGDVVSQFGWANSTDMVSSLAISRDHRFVFAGKEGKFELWDVSSKTKLRTFSGYKDKVQAIALSSDARRALAGDVKGRLMLWDVETGQVLHILRTEGPRWNAMIDAAAISPDGRLGLTGGGGDSTLQLWDLQSGREAVPLEADKKLDPNFHIPIPAVSWLAIFPDARTAMTAGDPGRAMYVWDLKTGKQLRRIEEKTRLGGAFALTRDGRFAASAYWLPPSTNGEPPPRKDLVMKLWEVSSGKVLHNFTGSGNLGTGLGGNIDTLAFSPDGRFILSGGIDDWLRLWDVSEWTKPGK